MFTAFFLDTDVIAMIVGVCDIAYVRIGSNSADMLRRVVQLKDLRYAILFYRFDSVTFYACSFQLLGLACFLFFLALASLCAHFLQ